LFFANRRDEGPSFPEIFSPFPKPAMAFILTILENCIDEWVTGVRADVAFTANDYREVYDSHLKALDQFDAHTKKHGIVDLIQTRLYNVGRFHSGAEPTALIPRAVIQMADVRAAIQE
ncbi:hypothetical protein R3P38DRAFT_2455019, partial [Favolaschia claudopus]